MKERLTRRSVLAAPGVLAGCTPEGTQPVTGSPGAPAAAPASRGGWTGWAPTPEEAWALLPPTLQRRLAEEPAFANSPEPGIASYETPYAAPRGALLQAGRIGPLNWSRARWRQDGRLLRSNLTNLTLGGLEGLGGAGRVASARPLNTRNAFFPRNDGPGADVRWWGEILELEGRAFPLREGNTFRVRFESRHNPPEAQEYGFRNSWGFIVRRRWRPWELWRALVIGDLYPALGAAPPDFLHSPAFLQGDFFELSEHPQNPASTRPQEFELYSDLLGMHLATGKWGEGTDPQTVGSLMVNGHFTFLPDTAAPEPALIELSPAGMARYRAAQAALATELGEMAARSGRLTAGERARATDAFRTSFELWQAGNFRAAFLGFSGGLAIDPANGPGHFYAGSSAMRMIDTAHPRESSATFRRAATQHLHRYHLTAAARFAPTSREGMEAAGLLRS